MKNLSTIQKDVRNTEDSICSEWEYNQWFRAQPENGKIEVPVEIARYILLHKNPCNRRMNAKHVAWLRSKMEQGRWRYNGDSIRFDKDGNLVDGQNRLMAAIQLGVSLVTSIVKNLARESFSTIDQGRGRSGEDTVDVAGKHGHPNVRGDISRLSPALRVVWKYFNGQMLRRQKVDNDTIKLALDQFPGVSESVEWIMSLSKDKTINISESMLAAAHYIFQRLDRKMASNFMEQVMTGRNLDDRDPAFVLRRKITQTGNKIKAGDEPAYKLALLIKSWNTMRKGGTIQRLEYRIHSEGVHGIEPYPKAI
jgi:hypothetical protein